MLGGQSTGEEVNVSNAYETAKAVVLASNEDTQCERCKPYVDELIRNEIEQRRRPPL